MSKPTVLNSPERDKIVSKWGLHFLNHGYPLVKLNNWTRAHYALNARSHRSTLRR
jgi:hypothetical protein